MELRERVSSSPGLIALIARLIIAVLPSPRMKSLLHVFAKAPRGALRRLSSSAMPYTKLEPVDVLAPATRVLRMQRPPVNSLSLEVLSSFAESLAEAESDPACRAVVLASASPTVFCAGLDITEMHEPKPERLHQFWHTLQEVWIKLSTSRVATIAAIEGHSPAGGCMLAMSCDWRVMALADPIKGKPLTIGLNETKLGIVAPFWFADTMEYVVGARQTDLLLQTGALLTTEEALAVGLVDEAVAHDQVMSRAAARQRSSSQSPTPLGMRLRCCCVPRWPSGSSRRAKRTMRASPRSASRQRCRRVSESTWLP